MRYLGIGAMLFAGTWTFLKLIKPLAKSIILSLSSFSNNRYNNLKLPQTDCDIPMPFILSGIFIMAAVLFLFSNLFSLYREQV